MPHENPRRAAVACAAAPWRTAFAQALLAQGLEVHTASTAQELIDLLHKHLYELLLFDESADGAELSQACLIALDRNPNLRSILAAGLDESHLEKVGALCHIRFSGTREKLLAALRQDDSVLLEAPSTSWPGSERPGSAGRGH